jgi:hypothetical protein
VVPQAPLASEGFFSELLQMMMHRLFPGMNSNKFIWIPPLNAVMTIGDFLIAARDGNASAIGVCIICEVILPSNVKVTWWLTCQELEGRRVVRVPTPPHISDYSNLLKCRLNEVFEDCIGVSVISINDVHDIAFVFHLDVLEKKFVNCAGMSRVYFSRYCIQRNGEFSTCDHQVMSPFLYSPCESYPSWITDVVLFAGSED